MLLGSWLKSISAKGLFFYIQRRKILPYMEENSYDTEMCASDWSPLKRNCKVGFFVGGGGTKQFVWALDKYVTKPQLGHSFSSPPPSDSLSQKFCWTVVCSFNVLENELNITSSESKTAQIFGEKGCNLIRTESLLKVRCCSEGTRNF